MSDSEITVLCIGDVVARPGREAIQKLLPALREEFSADFVVVNGENSAGGSGIDKKCYREIKDGGADVITLGDHTWRRTDVRTLLQEKEDCLCPGNYPAGSPVRGWGVYECQGVSIGVMNVLGRTFLQTALNCPFQYAESVFADGLSSADITIVDFHGEATSEKLAFARRFDGEVSLVYGTHTHVATADESILPGGTAFITDIGMTGAHGGVIGMEKETAIKRFLTGMPSSYKPSHEDVRVNGICVRFDKASLNPVSIERVQRKLEE